MKLFKLIQKLSKLLRARCKTKHQSTAGARPEPAPAQPVYPTTENTTYNILPSGSALDESLFPYVNIPAPLAPHRDITRLVRLQKWDLPSIPEHEDDQDEPMQETGGADSSNTTTTAEASCRLVWWAAYPTRPANQG